MNLVNASNTEACLKQKLDSPNKTKYKRHLLQLCDKSYFLCNSLAFAIFNKPNCTAILFALSLLLPHTLTLWSFFLLKHDESKDR